MADTGFKTTGAVVFDGDWVNMTTTRINTSDNSRATTTNTTFTPATLQNYAFGIPSGATIDGIEVQCEFNSASAGGTATIQYSLSWDNGTTYTSTKSDTVTSVSDATKTYGGATDTWGRSWTSSEFADGTFLAKMEGKRETGGGVTCGVDWMAIKVYYTEGSQSGFFLLMSN